MPNDNDGAVRPAMSRADICSSRWVLQVLLPQSQQPHPGS